MHRIISRLLFQRVCEDRGIDTHCSLESLAHDWRSRGARQKELWPILVSNFHSIADTFNGGLYGRRGQPRHFSESLNVHDTWLANFIDKLSAEDSSYLFSYVPIEILGSVYERFLGGVVQPNGKVVPKPEVRRAGGVYYTPRHVVEYIVNRTISPLIFGKSPREVQKLKFLDPACGSGSFLLRVFERICEHYVEWYLVNSNERTRDACYFDNNGDLRLTTGLKREILRNCIYGVDIDPQAVEVTQLSLYLKLLENETQETISKQIPLFRYEALLPDLSENVVTANSLLDPDARDLLFDDFDVSKLNPLKRTGAFDPSGGFNAVIGNPPYDVLERDRLKSSWPHLPLRRYIELTRTYDAALGGKLNLFRLFIVRSLDLLKSGGRLGMILPLSLLGDISCKRTRGYVLARTRDFVADCFPQKDDKNRRIFFDAKLSTVVLTAENTPTPSRRKQTIGLNVYPANSFQHEHKNATISVPDLSLVDPATPVPLVDDSEWAILRDIYAQTEVGFLGQAAEFSITRGEINQRTFARFITRNKRHARLVKGVEIGPFRENERLSQGERNWLDEAAYLRHYSKRCIIKERRIAVQRITGVDEQRRLVATIIEPPAYFADSTNSIAVGIASPYTLEYLLALLNSALFQWRFSLTSTNNNVGTNELSAMPFRRLDFSDPRDDQMHKIITSTVREILTVEVQIAASSGEHDIGVLKRSRSFLQGKLDKLVGQLFGLERFAIRPWEERVPVTRRRVARADLVAAGE